MKKNLTVLLVLVACSLCLLSACTQISDQTLTWQEQYDLGVRYLSEGNYEEAIIAFTAAIEIDPKQAPAYMGRGNAYVLSGKTEENLAAAQADYEKAIELDDTNVGAYLGLADVYIQRRDYNSALKILQGSLGRTEDSEEILNKIAEVEKLLGPEDSDSEITVLTKQEVTKNVDEWGKYSAEKTTQAAYHLYQYDEEGYMIHSESWSNNYNIETKHHEWIKTSSNDWVYNPEMNKWTNNYERKYGPQNGSVELEQYSPGTHHYTEGLSGEVSITVDPYPVGKPSVVYNPSYSEKSVGYEWYFAKYTYDKDGNAILIESYSKDGKLLGTCTLEYEVILSTN